MGHNKLNLSNNGGPLHYLGNRNLSLPDSSGRMKVDLSWFNEHFLIMLEHCKGRKFKKCFDPFSGCASWSLIAMELKIAEEYIINDSDAALINTHRLMKERPDAIKAAYASLVEEYSKTKSNKNFFLQVIKDYNSADNDGKALLLSFIINHSWGGMVFHDDKGNIVYREANSSENAIPGYLEEATLPLGLYFEEVDRVSRLLNTNKVSFKSGDFLHAISDVQPGDFVAMFPPYPENVRARIGEVGIFVELYNREILHKNLLNAILHMENRGIEYYMTYGFHDPETKSFIIRDASNQLRHFFRILGYQNCTFGIALEQMYFSPNLLIPNDLDSAIIRADDVLQKLDLTCGEALSNFYQIAKQRQS